MVITLCMCVFALASSKGTDTAEEYVDLIELNHFYDYQGRHVYDQVIFYELSPETGRFQVRAWCLIEDRDHLNRRPVKNAQTQRYQVDWFDKDQRLMRKITSRLFRESWTQIDPERVNKKIFQERSRIALVQNPKKFLADKQTQQADEAKQTTTQANVQPNATVPTSGADAGPAGAAGTVPMADALVLR